MTGKVTRRERKELEGRLRLACDLARKFSDAPPKSIRSTLARLQPANRMPVSLDPHHQNFIGDTMGMIGLAHNEYARALILWRMQVDPGKRRPKYSFAELAADLDITERHAKRLYKDGLDQIVIKRRGLSIALRAYAAGSISPPHPRPPAYETRAKRVSPRSGGA